MKKILLSITIGFLFSISVFSQNSEDALRYSGYNLSGSARFMGVSGAMGSIGGDLTSINYNPAGLGIYKSSEYLFAPRYLHTKNEASYSGDYRYDTRDNLNFGLVGLVTSIPLVNSGNSDVSGWKYAQFGFSINRVDNYRSDIFIEGNSYGGSKVDQWQNEANGEYPNNLNSFSSNLAWETYLLDTINGYPTQYSTAVPNGGVNQSYSSHSEGYKNEMSFAFSGNYNNRLFVGASMAFSFVNFYRTANLTETALENPEAGEFDYFSYREDLSTKGNGFNAKFGMIYMITPAIRLNAAFHTPTWFYRMNDNYFTRVDSKMSGGDNYSKSSPNGAYSYKLYTPLRAMGGLSFFVSNLGFVSVDYEYMDYGQARLKAYDYSFSDENQDISRDFVGTHSLRIGTEWRFHPLFIRGGYGFSTSPISSDLNDVYSTQFSLGMGYRSGPFYFDLSFMQKQSAQNYYMYDAAYVNPAYLESTYDFYTFSLGFKF